MSVDGLGGRNLAFDDLFGQDLSDLAGAPRYDALKAAATKGDVRGRTVLFASLEHLIAMKEASGRTNDKLMATEYRVLSDELRAPKLEQQD